MHLERLLDRYGIPGIYWNVLISLYNAKASYYTDSLSILDSLSKIIYPYLSFFDIIILASNIM